MDKQDAPASPERGAHGATREMTGAVIAFPSAKARRETYGARRRRELAGLETQLFSAAQALEMIAGGLEGAVGDLLRAQGDVELVEDSHREIQRGLRCCQALLVRIAEIDI